jgi:ATP-binding cassette, subfamily B, bacterial
MDRTNKLTIFTCMKFLWQYAKKYKRNFILFYIGWLVQTLIGAISPILIALMIDEVVYYKNMEFFLRISLIFVVLSVFSCTLYFAIYTIHHYLISMYTFDIKSSVFNHALRAKPSYLSSVSTGYIMTLLSKDAGECMHIIIRNVLHFINAIIRVLFCLVFVSMYNWKMGVLMISALPLTLFVNRHYGKQRRKQSEKYMTAYSGFSGFAMEMLAGLREIKLMAAQKSADNYFAAHIKEMIKIKIKASFADLKARQLTSLIALLVDLSMYILAGFLAFRGDITLGMFMAILEYFKTSSTEIEYLSENNMDMHNRLVNVQRIYDFLQTKNEDDWEGTKDLEVTEGSIAFNNVSFDFSGRNSLISNIDFHIKGGERVALAGASGSGKTTLVNLLLGFYKPKTGTITIDGMDIEKCSLKSLRQQIGIVQQEVLMFDGTIRMNLKLGNHRATDEEMMAACDKAAIGDFVRSLPQGLDTIIGKEGRGLSGGQKQRFSIARIYLKNPRILIFDEATSSLDHQSESLVHSAWEELCVGRTTIIISHRPSSIEKCDRVINVSEGRAA